MEESLVPVEKPEPRTTNGPRGIHPAIRKVWRFSGIVSSLPLSLFFAGPAFGVLMFALRGPLGQRTAAIIAISAAVAVWLVVMAFLLGRINAQWRNWTYEVRERDVVLSWGVWWKTRRCVPRDRLQHVDVNSGPLDRKFGLVQVSLFSAGGAIGSIPGLTPEEADDLREMILESQAVHV